MPPRTDLELCRKENSSDDSSKRKEGKKGKKGGWGREKVFCECRGGGGFRNLKIWQSLGGG